MNPNKVNNGWTLNPSKSFPGKFYYFNVLNGKSAWTSDPEKNVSKDSDIHKISDRSFFPQEPTTPPAESPSTSSAVPFLLNQSKFIRPPDNPGASISLNQYQMPSFGRAVFPNYVSNVEPYIPNIIWAPIPVPTVPYMCKPTEARQYANMCTQTDVIGKVHVNTCTTSSSECFTDYNSNVHGQINKFYETSTPIKSRYKASTSQSFFNIFHAPEETDMSSKSLKSPYKRVQTKYEADNSTVTSPDFLGFNKLDSFVNFNKQTPVNRSCEDFKTMSVMKETFKRACTISAQTETPERFELNSNESVYYYNDLQRRKSNQFDANTSDATPKLAANDLRLMLIAKRRKSFDLGKLEEYASKKIKTYKEEQGKPSTRQKRVSFSLHPKDSDTEDHGNETVETNDEDTEGMHLKLRKDLWYVMVDPETFLDEYQLIEEYVLLDETCRLLLPRCLQSAIEAMGKGDCRGRQRAIVARQSARKLAQPPAYIVTMPEFDISSNTSDISDVLKYCLKINKLGNLVVLITNSAKLLMDAKSLNINCLDTKRIKSEILTTPPEITFDLKKVEINIRNDCFGENVFVPPSEFKRYVLNNRYPNPENVSNKNSNHINEGGVKTVDDNTSPIGCNNLIDITRKKRKTNQINEEPTNYEEAAANIGIDIKNLFLNEDELLSSKANKENKHKFQKPKALGHIDTKKVVSGNESHKKYGLGKFDVKSNLMEETIKTRFDEWICSLSQIVEEALTQVLTRHTKFNESMIPPWVLYDVVHNIKKLYDSHTEIKSLADKFNIMLLEQCSQIGILKSMSPSDFMDLFKCAYSLIQALKLKQPTYLELSDAESQLNHLLSEIENPTDVILPVVPPVTKLSITIENSKQNFVRHPSDIIDYVKKHFEDWKDYEPSHTEKIVAKQKNENCINDIKIVRTFGRNLKHLNIDGKTLTVTTPIETVEKENTGNSKDDKVTSTNNLLEDLNLSNSETCFDEAKTNDNKQSSENNVNAMNNEPKTTRQENNTNRNVATPIHNINNGDETNETPVTILEPENELPTEPKNLDLDALDYSEIKETDSPKITPADENKNDSDMSMTDTVSFVYEIKKSTNTNRKCYFNVNNVNKIAAAESNVNMVTSDVSIDRFDISVKDDSVNDSGFENDSVHAHSLVKAFLFELSYSFKLIHVFIGNCVKDFRDGNVREDQKHRLHAKADILFSIVAEVITKLKKIIQRESNESTALQAMLLRAGVQASEDKRITRYKQVVTKCLEQAITLENALKIMLSLTGDDYDGSISTCTLDTDIRYFNIFG